ncbi:PH domain-containing protein [Microlunatus soli]|uniref:PH domain-containing protein n=1 Tax=Microlunatus soli TaxID=630515 RepID=A0A1H1ZX46_9ACTN|nr:PH domain-containing protein [Microlunatus soli]
MAGFWRKFADPRVSSHLIADEGEIVVDEVRRHPMAFVLPVLIIALGLLVILTAFVVPVQIALLPIVVGLVVIGIGGYRMLAAHMDRFVITNMRVFRVRGIFSQHTATMPMSRILDISVHKPMIGRIFSYGHFVFESAAQDQGLRDIRYVARPDERDLTIQRVIQRSGLRSSMRPLSDGREARGGDDDDLDLDLLDDGDPTDGSRTPTPEEDAAWLAGNGPARDPVHGTEIPSRDVMAHETAGDGADESRHWTQAWSVRDRAEHQRARQQVAGSEAPNRSLRDRLPGAARVTLSESDPDDADRSGSRVPTGARSRRSDTENGTEESDEQAPDDTTGSRS